MKLRRPVLVATSGVLLLTLAACGGGNDSTASAAQGAQGSEQGGYGGGGQGTGQGGGQGSGRFPGANGLVADISGKTLQVQGQDGQTAVTYTGATTFTAQVSAKLADVTVGSCVQVSAPQDDTTGSVSASATPPTAIVAATVRIIAATDGSCTRGGFGGGGAPSGRPSDLPSDLPSERPGGAPSGGPGGRGFGGFGAFGQVTAVSGTGFTVAQQRFGQDGQDDETTDVAVTVAAATTYTTTQDATATALAVGTCVSATGEADATGAVKAQRISISDAVDGRCAVGFAGFGGGRPGAGQGTQQGAGQ